MKLGVFTCVVNNLSLKEALDYFKTFGIQMVEIGCGGYPGDGHSHREELLAAIADGEAAINASVVDAAKVKAAEDRLNAILFKYTEYTGFTYDEEPSDADIFFENALEGTSKFLVDTIGGGSLVDWVLSPARNLVDKIFG